MGRNVIEVILWFSLYSFMGWMLETVFKSVRDRHFVNSGFLYGPFVPIYGFAAILVNYCLALAKSSTALINNPLVSGALSVFLVIIATSLLEYFTGALLESLFKRQWWDYSDQRFNIKGRISLNYSIAWAILGCFVLKAAHPLVLQTIRCIPFYLQDLFAVALGVFLMLDLAKQVDSLVDIGRLSCFSLYSWRDHLTRRYTFY